MGKKVSVFYSEDFHSALSMVLTDISSDVDEFIQLLEENTDGQLFYNTHNPHIHTHIRTYRHIVHTDWTTITVYTLQILLTKDWCKVKCWVPRHIMYLASDASPPSHTMRTICIYF